MLYRTKGKDVFCGRHCCGINTNKGATNRKAASKAIKATRRRARRIEQVRWQREWGMI